MVRGRVLVQTGGGVIAIEMNAAVVGYGPQPFKTVALVQVTVEFSRFHRRRERLLLKYSTARHCFFQNGLNL
jgi:hypothetical protein